MLKEVKYKPLKFTIGGVLLLIFIALFVMNIILALRIAVPDGSGNEWVFAELLDGFFDPKKTYVPEGGGRPVAVPYNSDWWWWGVLPIDLVVTAGLGAFVFFAFVRPILKAKKTGKVAVSDANSVEADTITAEEDK